MFENLDVLRMSGGMARHAEARQAELARNLANADTPGFRARDLTPFAEAYRSGPPPQPMRATRPGHVQGAEAAAAWRVVDAPDGESPNGNTVSLEDQMLKMAEVGQSHDEALAVYASALKVLRASIGGR